MILIQIITTILICNIFHLSNADSHICSGVLSNCAGNIIQCKPNEPCDITCTTWSKVCENTQINCPHNHNCTLLCNGIWTCEMLTIYAHSSYQLSITCNNEQGSCENIAVYCPPNVDNTKRCTINAGNELFGLDYGEQVLGFYAINGWNDLDIIYSGTWSNGKTSDQHMYCTSNYSESCNIATGAWNCENVQDICNNPPTSQPTTSISITSLPTAFVPTSIPTSVPTSIPTSVPTFAPTFIPTSVPTFIPTSVPTFIPTTTNPTSINATNYNEPETSSQTTQNITTAYPISIPSWSPIYTPTASPDKKSNGKVDDMYTTHDNGNEKTPLNKTVDSDYIAYIMIALAVFMIIFVVSCLFIRKRKRIKEMKNITSNIDIGNGNNNTFYERALDKSPSNTENEMNKESNSIVNEIQLTPTLYKEGNDLVDENVDDMYINSDVLTNDENNTSTTKGETNTEGEVKSSNKEQIMEDMDDMYDIDTSQINGNITTKCETKTTGNV